MSTGALFPQETHSSSKVEQKWKEGHILVLDICVNDSEYILINLYNAKTKKDKINILINIFLLLEMFDINPKN